jgi:hypothetical protein
MHVWDIAVKAGPGIVVSQQTDVLELISENWGLVLVCVDVSDGGCKRAIYKEDDCLCF